MTLPAPAFTGPIPELYDRHLGPVLFEPYAIDLASRLPPGTTTVLEIAAGTGRLTRHLLAALPANAVVLATDLSEAMLARADAAIDDPRVTWRAADAQALPVANGGQDVVACQFGLMFVPDKLRALCEMRRVLRPGGRLLLSTWDRLERNVATAMLHALAVAAAPDAPADFMLTPFSLHDPEALRALALGAGFAEVRVDTVAVNAHAESAAHLAVGMVRGNPLWHQLAQRGVDAAAFERTVTAELVARYGDRPCRHALSAHVVTAC
jgi:ubiquinone/menaquinone biosynthesis C-methylase UbiE